MVSSITRSGTTFTAKNPAGTSLFTFTQQDNNTVTNVKGDRESSYRSGNVNLTAANIGAVNVSTGWGLKTVDVNYYNNGLSIVGTLSSGAQYNLEVNPNGANYYHRDNNSQGWTAYWQNH